MTIDIIMAAKSEFSDRNAFVQAALEKHCFGYPEWLEEMLTSLSPQTAKDEDVEIYLYEMIEKMNEKVEISLEDVSNIQTLFKPAWNDAYFVFESEFMYYFYNWHTSA